MKRMDRFVRFLNGRGFYVALCGCMAALGLAAYSAMDHTAVKQTPDPEPLPPVSISEPSAPAEESREPLVSEPQPAEQPVAGEIKAERFVRPFAATPGTPYDENELQFSPTFEDWRLHTGADYFPTGSLVVSACGAGTVVAVDTHTALGDVITVNHGGGIYLRYCGVKHITVSPGDTVAEGEPLGEVGVVESECEEAAHLHLEAICDGVPVDPETLFE